MMGPKKEKTVHNDLDPFIIVGSYYIGIYLLHYHFICYVGILIYLETITIFPLYFRRYLFQWEIDLESFFVPPSLGIKPMAQTSNGFLQQDTSVTTSLLLQFYVLIFGYIDDLAAMGCFFYRSTQCLVYLFETRFREFIFSPVAFKTFNS